MKRMRGGNVDEMKRMEEWMAQKGKGKKERKKEKKLLIIFVPIFELSGRCSCCNYISYTL